METCISKIKDKKQIGNYVYFDTTQANENLRCWFLDNNKYQVDRKDGNKYVNVRKGTWLCVNDEVYVKFDDKTMKLNYSTNKWETSTTPTPSTTELSDIEKTLFEKMRQSNITTDKSMDYLNTYASFLTQTQKEDYVKKYKQYLDNPTPPSSEETVGQELSDLFKKWKGNISSYFDDLTKQPELESWVPQCLKKLNVLQTTDSGKTVKEQVVLQTDTDREYFWQDGDFSMVNRKTKTRSDGKWSCSSGKLVITLDSGNKFEDGKGWSHDTTITTPQQTPVKFKPVEPVQPENIGPEKSEPTYVGFGEI